MREWPYTASSQDALSCTTQYIPPLCSVRIQYSMDPFFLLVLLHCWPSSVCYILIVSKQRLCWVGWVVQHLNNGVALERALHCLLDETGNYKHIHNFHVIIYNSNPLNNAVQQCIAMQELCHAMHHNDPPVRLPPYFYCSGSASKLHTGNQVLHFPFRISSSGVVVKIEMPTTNCHLV